jgi:hypothetical protein
MCLQVGEDADLTLCEAPSRYYTPMLLRSKARLTMDEGLTLYARVASAAPAARFKRGFLPLGPLGLREIERLTALFRKPTSEPVLGLC